MSVKQDLTGQIFGELIVIKDSGKRYCDRSIIWICECICGKITKIPTFNLKTGNTKSCGHLFEEIVYKRHVTNKMKMPKNNTTRYIGVGFRNDIERWRSTIAYKHKVWCLGTFDFIEDAIEARNNFIIKNNLQKEYKVQEII